MESNAEIEMYKWEARNSDILYNKQLNENQSLNNKIKELEYKIKMFLDALTTYNSSYHQLETDGFVTYVPFNDGCPDKLSIILNDFEKIFGISQVEIDEEFLKEGKILIYEK